MQITSAWKAADVPPVTRRSAARWWLVAPTLMLFVIINQLDKTNISVLIADRGFVADLGAAGQHARLGFLSSSFFIGYGISLLIWGFVVDRIGPRRSALIGVLGWAVTTIWCARAATINEMYIARFALGLTEGCMWPVCNKYVGRWFPVREHGRIQAFWINGAQIGIAIGLPIVTAILLAAGWRAVFLVFGAASVVVLLPILSWLAPDDPAQSRWVSREEREYIEAQRPASHAHNSVTLSFLRSTRFWLVALCHACLVATFFGLVTWIPTYLTKARGMPFTTMSAWVALSYMLPVLLAVGIGWIADRTASRARVAAICSCVMSVMIVAAVMVPNAIVSMLLLVVSMAAPITYGAVNTSLMHSLVSPEQIGRSTGIFVGVANVLGAGGPTVVGWLIGLFHGEYYAAFGFIAALNAIQALLYIVIDHV